METAEILNETVQKPEVQTPGEQPKNFWKPYERFAVRTTFLFVIQLCIPMRLQFYERLLHVKWSTFNWQTLSGLTGVGAPEYINVGTDIWELYSYINIAVALGISVVLASLWAVFSKQSTYTKLYYWTRVIARYASAYGIIAWGMKKFVPKQMELPSITFLETPFADFSEQKIYWQCVGIAQPYEVFLGFAEIMAGVLLLFRKTTSVGAALLAVMLFNICVANHAYDGMVHVGSMTYAILGSIVLWFYLPDIYRLLIQKKDVLPKVESIEFPGWKNQAKLFLKYSITCIFIFYSLYLHLDDYVGYRYPHDSPGLKDAQGVYEVSEFKLNNRVIPYDPLDSVRWQSVVFEKWSTLTYKVNRAQQMDIDNTGREGKESVEKRFEFRGIGGGRIYFDYKADTTAHLLYLVNKNKVHRNETWLLHYDRPSEGRIVLKGTNEFRDSVEVILDRQKKDYALYEHGPVRTAGWQY